MADSAESQKRDQQNRGTWWYEGPCPECGKAVADCGDVIKCLGCGLGVSSSEVNRCV